MSDTPPNTPRDNATGTSQSGDLTGISEMFGLRDGQTDGGGSGTRLVRRSDWQSVGLPSGDTGTRTGTDTVGRWVAATEGVDQPPDVSSRLVHGRYRLIAELGVGGMGVTYRAWDTKAGIPVVVKMPRREVRSDSEAMQRFAREIDAMLAVPQDNIVPITDHGDDDGCPFVVMRFLPGGSLADYRRRDEAGNAIRNPPGMLHFWLPGVAAALDHIHGKGMLHRDVKPGNIFLDGFLKPYLGDFGIAKVVDESGGLVKEQTLTATKMAVGTPEYMAPELFKPRSKPNGRVDQYALAVTVYEMLSGEKPFKGDRAHIIVEHSGLPVPPLSGKVPGLPQSLCSAVEKGLAKSAADRFPTCREFAAAVVAELAMLPPEAETVRLLCPSCKNILKLPQKAAGKTGRCPRCQAAMDVAADLGSLWLESEERGGEAAADGSTSTPPAVAEKLNERPPEPDPVKAAWLTVHWAAIGAAAIAGVLTGSLFPRPTRTVVFREEMVHRPAEEVRRLQRDADNARKSLFDAESQVKDLEERVRAQETLIAGLEKVKTERDSLSLETQRLTKDLAGERVSGGSKPSSPELPPGMETLTNSIGMRFNLCPSGTFVMGSAGGHRDEKPPHNVEITKPFYLGVFEVTSHQWTAVTGSSLGDTRAEWRNAPVMGVDWEDAIEFCQKLSSLKSEREAGRTYRLPTEAEWEYACRAGTNTKYSFGDDESKLSDYAWFNSSSSLHLVGQKKPNAWGLYDMHGNVTEWCSDFYDPRFYAKANAVDPKGPSSGVVSKVPSGWIGVFRGGGSFDSPDKCRSAYRFHNFPPNKTFVGGLRVVCEVN